MAFKTLSDLPAPLQTALRAELGLSAETIALVEWHDSHEPARIIVEAWDRDASSGRCTKRYLLGRTFWWGDAVSFVGQFEMPNIRHTIVPANEAAQRLFELEFQAPSDEFIRTGRIWDMAVENCRRFERQLDTLHMPATAMPALLAA